MKNTKKEYADKINKLRKYLDKISHDFYVDSDSIEDRLVLGININEKDKSTIIVGRNVDNLKYETINQLFDGEAEDIYYRLIGENKSCGWCNKYDEVLCDDWGNCFKYCPICGRNLGNGI